MCRNSFRTIILLFCFSLFTSVCVSQPKTIKKTGKKKTTVRKKTTFISADNRGVKEVIMPNVSRSDKDLVELEFRAYSLFKEQRYEEASQLFLELSNANVFIFKANLKEPVDTIIRRYVESQMYRFLVKGEYEKSSAYVQRIKVTNRNLKIQHAANSCFEEFKRQERANLSIRDFKIVRYYPDDEAFLLSSRFGYYLLNVDIKSARKFKQAFYQAELKDMDFSMYEGRLIMTKFTIASKEAGTQYVFDLGIPIVYSTMYLEAHFSSRLGTGDIPVPTNPATDIPQSVFRSVIGTATPQTTIPLPTDGGIPRYSISPPKTMQPQQSNPIPTTPSVPTPVVVPIVVPESKPTTIETSLPKTATVSPIDSTDSNSIPTSKEEEEAVRRWWKRK
ncbi:MAG: hypothetical protein ACRCSB_00615 [Bacteroidales bacterium]